ncbi:unnamed protein product [Closterium sp. NIES-54]
MDMSHYPHPPHAEPTTHGAAGASESRYDAAAAGPDHHQGLHAKVQTDHHWSHRLHCPTPSAASIAATRASTSATGPTTATTSTASTSSTAAPTTTPTATSTTTAASSTTPSTLALPVAALRTSRSSTNVLRNRDVCSSSRGEGGGKGGGGAPLKEG